MSGDANVSAIPARCRGDAGRVVQIIDNLALGGAQRLLVTFAHAVGPAAAPDVLALAAGGGFRPLLEREGCKVAEMSAVRIWNPLSVLRIARHLRRSGARCVHCHLSYATILAAPAARLAGARVVVSLHNTDTVDPGNLKARVLSFLEGISLRFFTDRVIFVGGNVERANRARLGRTPGVTIANVISPPPRLSGEERARIRNGLGAAPGDVVVIAAGRLSEQKDPLLLVRAFADARTRCAGLRLWMVGEGELQAEAELMARSLGLGDSIRFLGMRTDVDRLMGSADVFALPSRWEGLPVALLEAMAAGIAVVTTAVGDVPTVLQPDEAVMVPVSDPVALGAALERLASDGALRLDLGRRAERAARAYVDVAGWRARLEAVYADAV